MLSYGISIIQGTDEDKLHKAIEAYKIRYGVKPQVIAVNPNTFTEFSHETFHGVAIKYDEKLKLNDFFLKVE